MNGIIALIVRAIQKKHLIVLALGFALYGAADFANDARVYAETVLPGGDSENGPVIQRTRAAVPIEGARQNAETFVQIRFRDVLAGQTQASRSIVAQQLLAEAKASRHHDAVTLPILRRVGFSALRERSGKRGCQCSCADPILLCESWLCGNCRNDRIGERESPPGTLGGNMPEHRRDSSGRGRGPMPATCIMPHFG